MRKISSKTQFFFSTLIQFLTELGDENFSSINMKFSYRICILRMFDWLRDTVFSELKCSKIRKIRVSRTSKIQILYEKSILNR